VFNNTKVSQVQYVDNIYNTMRNSKSTQTVRRYTNQCHIIFELSAMHNINKVLCTWNIMYVMYAITRFDILT